MASTGRREYEEINSNLFEEEINLRSNANGEGKSVFLLRQVLVCSGMWASYFACGLCLGAPAVIVPQLRRAALATRAPLTQEAVSWLSSTIGYSASVVVMVLAILSRSFGRKLIFLVSLLVAAVGFVILYFSTSVTQLVIGFIFVGFLLGNQTAVCLLIMTEYTSPRYRGVFLMMKSALLVWGIWIANIIGTFFHWKHIFTLGFLWTLYAIMTIFKTPDSPYWLAARGRYSECAAAHRWLKGYSAESNRELDDLLEREKSRERERSREGHESSFGEYYSVMCSRAFLKPLLLAMLMMALYNSTGKMACTVYAVDIIKKVTGSESTAYCGMLALDGLSVMGMYVGCGVSRLVGRRPLLFTTTGLLILFLYLLSLYLYLVQRGLLHESTVASMLLLAAYTLSACMGPMMMATSLVSELFPLSLRNLFSLLIGVYSYFIFASFLKIAPMLVSVCGVSGAFFFYATLASVCTILLYIYLPETKDKTLVDIEILVANNQLR